MKSPVALCLPIFLGIISVAQTNVTIGKEVPLNHSITQRDVSYEFHRPMSREDIWAKKILPADLQQQNAEPVPQLVKLISKIFQQYLSACVPIVLYDDAAEAYGHAFLQHLFKSFPASYIHGKITMNATLPIVPHLLYELSSTENTCRNFIIFLSDVLLTHQLIGAQIESKVLVIPRSTQWKLREFLASPLSANIVNLLVISEAYSLGDERGQSFVLYTHDLYTDGLGSNKPIVLTSWHMGHLTRSHVNLFPRKFRNGYAGHRFLVAAVDQPPYIFKRPSPDMSGNVNREWDGIELRTLNMLAEMFNFTFEIMEPRNQSLGPITSLSYVIQLGQADIAAGGMYVTADEWSQSMTMSVGHSLDCATFVTLTSHTLSRYRAVLGPFQYPVWIAIIAIYMFAIFPLAFSDRLSLWHLVRNFGEVENMFWYVFGTFTNCFTFTHEYSWSNSKKSSTRMLVGCYWVFTIIITSCYTSSIIAFMTLPVEPFTADSIDDLIRGFYSIGTLDHDGWEKWFSNSTDKKTASLLKHLELVSSVDEGLQNITNAFFWPYAFIGSRAQLAHIIPEYLAKKRDGKRKTLHIGNECFALFNVAFAYKLNSVFGASLNDGLLKLQQSGFIRKIETDMTRIKEKLITLPNQDERRLSLADTEGMFLLMLFGYLFALGVLMSEWVGGCTKRCRIVWQNATKRFGSSSSLPPSQKRANHVRSHSLPETIAILNVGYPLRRRHFSVSFNVEQEHKVPALVCANHLNVVEHRQCGGTGEPDIFENACAQVTPSPAAAAAVDIERGFGERVRPVNDCITTLIN